MADIVREQKYGSVTNSMAQKNLWLNERINRNINLVLAGGGSGEASPRNCVPTLPSCWVISKR